MAYAEQIIRIIKVAVWERSVIRTISLLINPRKGGRPEKDKIFSTKMALTKSSEISNKLIIWLTDKQWRIKKIIKFMYL